MSTLARPSDASTHADSELSWHQGWFVVLGATLMLLGIVGIAASVLVTLATTFFIGWLMLAGGIVHVVNGVRFRGRARGSFLLPVLLGFLYLAAGALLVASPLRGAVALTLLLSASMILIGLFRIVSAAVAWTLSRGWTLVNGLVTAGIGILIWLELPTSGLWVIGLFVGLDLLFGGWAFIAAALTARREPLPPEPSPAAP